ncbi:CoA-binding protein [Carnobacteriaceae bacterium zg-ZUI252]|nr:CoA-binding protein [Carnobacteriaceae bacterium zg-ZUI252]
MIETYLKTSKTIAVVGLSNRSEATSYRVSEYMQQNGYTIIPVNPTCAGETILGEKVYASLLDIPFPVDIVNVFRRSEFLNDVAKEFVQIDAKIFWAQLGLFSQEAYDTLTQNGVQHIVMDKCVKIEHRQMLANENQ